MPDPGTTAQARDIVRHYALDLTPAGFHAQIIGADGTQYIDPFQPGDDRHYIAYRKRDLDSGKQMRCEVDGTDLSTNSLPAHLKRMMPKVSSDERLL